MTGEKMRSIIMSSVCSSPPLQSMNMKLISCVTFSVVIAFAAFGRRKYRHRPVSG